MSGKLAGLLGSQGQHLGKLRARLLEHGPEQQLEIKYQRSLELERRLRFAIGLTIQRSCRLLGERSALLDSVSPLAVLGRGYSLTRRLPGRTLVRGSEEVDVGQRLEIILQRGALEAEVVAVNGNTGKKKEGE